MPDGRMQIAVRHSVTNDLLMHSALNVCHILPASAYPLIRHDHEPYKLHARARGKPRSPTPTTISTGTLLEPQGLPRAYFPKNRRPTFYLADIRRRMYVATQGLSSWKANKQGCLWLRAPFPDHHKQFRFRISTGDEILHVFIQQRITVCTATRYTTILCPQLSTLVTKSEPSRVRRVPKHR